MFDPKKPHATVFGIGNARFEQNGKLYDSHGNEIYDHESLYEAPADKQPDVVPVNIPAEISPPQIEAGPEPGPEIEVGPDANDSQPIPDDESIPEMHIKDHLPAKYVGNMNIQELREELESYGVDVDDAIKRNEEANFPKVPAVKPFLKDLLSAEREKRGV